MRITPWESWPARLALIRWSETTSARSGGVPAASKMRRLIASKRSAGTVGTALLRSRVRAAYHAAGALTATPDGRHKIGPEREGTHGLRLRTTDPPPPRARTV